MIAITGNTYPVKDQIKALGGRWNPEDKAWMVPDDKADQARQLVSGAVSQPRQESHSYRPHKCLVCGAVPHRDARGYTDIKIYRNGECSDCYQERKMGY